MVRIMKIEFIKGDDWWMNCIYIKTKKGQHFFFYELSKLRFRHTYFEWEKIES